ncbi:DEAD/DEAH box helicase [Nocardioides currus]|uniref:DEAD/DEAH box helicase n=1 Tax=Nocardioides currus TaxID=2133958 RepID=UPI001401C5D1|nr:helicase-related protein [Nocardioides currus]
MKLEEIAPGMLVAGILTEPARILTAGWPYGPEFLVVTVEDPRGTTQQSMLDRSKESDLREVSSLGPSRCDGDVRRWKMGTEAFRLQSSALVDPMQAVSTSSLRPLPHQIKAVYEEMLPRTPLRFLLADDPGAGKTIMCGLYVKELMLRGDLERCLVVAPGGLVGQWQDELQEKFGLTFEILTREMMSGTVGQSVFEDHPLLLARMDMLKRDDDVLERLDASSWDLVVVDEAHRMSATIRGHQLDPTKRYELGQRLGRISRHLLLMTATPHSGDPDKFRAFLGLLDEDRYLGADREAVVPGRDTMRRLLKEDLLTLEGRRLFPERRAYTVGYGLSPAETDLYEAVTEYVRQEMRMADRIADGDRKRATNVGFALTVLQRRLASSPHAILRSLERRRARLAGALSAPAVLDSDLRLPPGSLGTHVVSDERTSQEAEDLETTVSAGATAAMTRAELEAEIASLDELVPIARRVHESGEDTKWKQLRSLLEDHSLTRGPDSAPRKIIVFTEHRDTLSYLADRIRALPGRTNGVVEIHGGLAHSQRRAVERSFTRDPDVTVLVATDAAGEGLNLQAAHLMVNYDLPWNPNRLEQRFGRIHRIGQDEVCHLWNLVATDTREGAVYERLLTKMEAQREAFQGKVYDVLGEAFEDDPLSEMLLKAIRYGDDPKVRAQLDAVIDEKASEGIPELIRERAQFRAMLSSADLEEAQHRVDTSVADRLQPHHVAAWFETTFSDLGGRVRTTSSGAYDVQLVPEEVRTARDTSGVVRHRYKGVTFDPSRAAAISTGDSLGLVGPGHPLLESALAEARSRFRPDQEAGAVLVDDRDDAVPRLLIVASHELTDGHTPSHVLSRRVAFTELTLDDDVRDVGAAYLDYRETTEREAAVAADLLGSERYASWDLDAARLWTVHNMVGDHARTVTPVHEARIRRAQMDLEQRLATEPAYWRRAADGVSSGVRKGVTPETARRRAEEVERRLRHRLDSLAKDARVVTRLPQVVSWAIVLPARDLGTAGRGRATPSSDVVTTIVEAETSMGLAVETAGAVVVSRRPDGLTRWVDVAVSDATRGPVRFSRTQVVRGLNLGDRHRLALAQPGDDGTEVRYVIDPFARLRVNDLFAHDFELPWSTLWRAGSEPS